MRTHEDKCQDEREEQTLGQQQKKFFTALSIYTKVMRQEGRAKQTKGSFSTAATWNKVLPHKRNVWLSCKLSVYFVLVDGEKK